MTKEEFYTRHSLFSDLNKNKEFVSFLPSCPYELYKATQNLVLHENECQWGNYQFAKSRYWEANIRDSDEMISKIRELSSKSIIQHRDITEKLITSCRGASLLYVSFLREKNIPARLRSGFVSYHPIANFNMDHVIVEFFDVQKKTWQWVDILITEDFKKSNKKDTSFSEVGLTLEQFIPAEVAWERVRNNVDTAFNFGIGLFKNRRGLFTIRNKMMYELVLCLKKEMLPRDLWGFMLYDSPFVDPQNVDQLDTLDNLSKILLHGDLSEMFRFYKKTVGLQIPSIIMNDSALDGIKAVNLEGKHVLED